MKVAIETQPLDGVKNIYFYLNILKFLQKSELHFRVFPQLFSQSALVNGE